MGLVSSHIISKNNNALFNIMKQRKNRHLGLISHQVPSNIQLSIPTVGANVYPSWYGKINSKELIEMLKVWSITASGIASLLYFLLKYY